MSIRCLTHSNGQYGIRGQLVNVPIEVRKLVQCLPRNVPEDATIDVHIKRRLVNKASYKHGLVKRSNIHAWLKHLGTTPLYKYVNVNIYWSRLTQFAGDEAECDDDEITDLDDPVQAAIALNAVSRTLVYGISKNVHAMWGQGNTSSTLAPKPVLGQAKRKAPPPESTEGAMELMEETPVSASTPAATLAKGSLAEILDRLAETIRAPSEAIDQQSEIIRQQSEAIATLNRRMGIMQAKVVDVSRLKVVGFNASAPALSCGSAFFLLLNALVAIGVDNKVLLGVLTSAFVLFSRQIFRVPSADLGVAASYSAATF
ncbi:hypothetical protein HPB50_016154 [Hyalomma asiaticum]|uniref:Uncharacterized protein n=1 Tax=Hyalomma asiaticum TaxID=266040 RepID=A0ACB7SK86_HYAAI|nr:hypothetical protein HPB50_016154 [Hyalomma asiaticum]